MGLTDALHVHAAVLVFGIFCAVYGTTLYATVPPGDSGELIVVAHHLGVAHPPGYPTFTLLAHASIRIGWFFNVHNAAWCVNAMNALFGAMAAIALYWATYLLTHSALASLFSSIMAAASPLIWQYSITAEVFALNNLLCCLILVVAISFEQAAKPRRPALACAGAFICGLAMTNQHTSALLQLPVLLWVLWRGVVHDLWHPLRLTFAAHKTLLLCAFCYIMGLSPYLYLFLAASFKPAYTWGDTRTLAGFLHHVLRREYGTFDLAPYQPDESAFGRISHGMSSYITSFSKEESGLGQLGFAVAMVGMALLLAKRRTMECNSTDKPATSLYRKPVVDGNWTIGFMIVSSWLFYALFFHWRANLSLQNALYRGVSARFWQQPNLLLFIAMGIALDRIAGYLCTVLRVPKRLVSTLCIVVVASACIFQVTRSYSKLDESGNTYTADFGRSILAPLPKKSILLTKGDIMVNSARYVQGCEGFRQDEVVIIDQEMMTYPWYLAMHGTAFTSRGVKLPGRFYHVRGEGHFTMKEFLDANYDKFGGRIFVAAAWKDGDASHLSAYSLEPFGIAWKVIRNTDMQKLQHDLKARRTYFNQWSTTSWLALSNVRNFSLPDTSSKYPAESWEAVIRNDVLEAQMRWASFVLTRIVENQEWKDSQVDELLARSLNICDEYDGKASLTINRAFVYRNKGVAYTEAVRRRPADVDLVKKAIAAYNSYLTIASESIALSKKQMHPTGHLPPDIHELMQVTEQIKGAVKSLEAHLKMLQSRSARP
jgi:hypothetical protein